MKNDEVLWVDKSQMSISALRVLSTQTGGHEIAKVEPETKMVFTCAEGSLKEKRSSFGVVQT